MHNIRVDIGQVDLVSDDNKIYNMAAVAVSDVGTSYDTAGSAQADTSDIGDMVSMSTWDHTFGHQDTLMSPTFILLVTTTLMMDDKDLISFLSSSWINNDINQFCWRNCLNRFCLMNP